MSKRVQLVAELESCKDRNGRITKKAIVAKARRDKGSELYRKFKLRGLWNDKKAAEIARLEYAGELARRYLTIVVVNRNVKVSSVSYVHDPIAGHNVPGLRKLTDFNRTSAELAIKQEIASCEAIIKRARAIAAVLDNNHPGLLDKLESALAAIIAVRSELYRREAA